MINGLNGVKCRTKISFKKNEAKDQRMINGNNFIFKR